MRIVDDQAIREHASVRFRSEYHYAVFEYWRSAKVLAYLEKAGVRTFDRVLDDGCGGGGMGVSFAEEARCVIGIEPGDRFRMPASISQRKKASGTSASAAPTAQRCRLATAPSISCSRIPSSNTSPIRVDISVRRFGYCAPAGTCFCRPRPTFLRQERICRD